ncbi:MAG: hypothetical protein ICV60_03720 [Pyrinomonadaceae bacterium]|nr:hypothetical protein [Pyrinomonadaceae bacterium]
MRRNRIIGPSRLAVLVAVLTLIILPAALNGRAQAQGRDPVGGARSSEARRGDLMTADISRSKTPSERRLPYKKMKEDFEQLQLTNKRMSEAAGSTPALDYEQVRKDASEITRRAERLKKNLLLGEPDEDETPKAVVKASSAEELKNMIGALDGLVKNFIQNPIFQKPDVVDAEGWGRVRRDLDGIITLSEQIQRNAAGMSKASGKKL